LKFRRYYILEDTISLKMLLKKEAYEEAKKLKKEAYEESKERSI
jgi:hypothetical protein